jgi:hypothetical protein
VQARRVRRRRLIGVASMLSGRVHDDQARGFLQRWRTYASGRGAFQRRYDGMSAANRSALARGMFGKWGRYHARRQAQRWIHDAVQPVEAKVDIGLRTTSNTNDTIQRLIENMQRLEQQVEDIHATKVSHHQLRTGAFRGPAAAVGGAGRLKGGADQYEDTPRAEQLEAAAARDLRDDVNPYGASAHLTELVAQRQPSASPAAVAPPAVPQYRAPSSTASLREYQSREPERAPLAVAAGSLRSYGQQQQRAPPASVAMAAALAAAGVDAVGEPPAAGPRRSTTFNTPRPAEY